MLATATMDVRCKDVLEVARQKAMPSGVRLRPHAPETLLGR